MEGIVIKSIEYKEKSKLVYLYTPFGMKGVKALDAAKTKLGFVTTLNWVEFEATDSKLPTVIEYSLKESFYSLYSDLSKVGVLSPMLDLLLHLEDHVNHKRIFSFFQRILVALRDTKDPYYILSLFLVKMLAVYGVRPELKGCVLCGGTRIVHFSILEGGALCDSCASFHDKNYALYQAFRSLYFTNELEEQELPISYKELLDAIYSYYLVHANIKLKEYHL